MVSTELKIIRKIAQGKIILLSVARTLADRCFFWSFFRYFLLLSYCSSCLISRLVVIWLISLLKINVFCYRCLRIVYDSWRLFVDFSVDEPHVYQSSKKRNVLSDGLSFQKEGYSSFENNEVLSLQEKESSGEYKHGCKQRLTTRWPYEEAKECLLSLKISVDSLHKKQLFPYNPKVLLKRYIL